MRPDGYSWTLNYQSFKGLADATVSVLADGLEMLNALEGLMRMCFENLNGEESGTIIEMALAAIAKARGE